MTNRRPQGLAPRDRQAYAAVAALFLTNGALFANILPRYPEIKSSLGLSDATYGLAITAFPVGAILAGLASASLIRRFGSARVAVAGTILTAAGVFVAGIAPSLWIFVAVLAVAGAMDSVTDVGQNAHGLRVQRRYGRSIINSFHALWSVGAVIGGSMAAGAIAIGLPLGTHLAISGVLFSAVALVALRYCLPGLDTPVVEESMADPAEVQDAVRSGVPPKIIVALSAMVLIAIAGTAIEDAGNSWAALYLGESLGAAGPIAALGYISLVAAQFVGRILGDAQVDRFGQRTIARLGGAIAAIGMGLALAFPTVPGTIVGFALAGYGSAILVPTAMHVADELPGLRPGTGLMLVSWLMRVSFLLSPPIVGLIAEYVSLRIGLLSVPIAGMVVVVLAGFLPRRAPQG